MMLLCVESKEQPQYHIVYILSGPATTIVYCRDQGHMREPVQIKGDNPRICLKCVQQAGIADELLKTYEPAKPISRDVTFEDVAAKAGKPMPPTTKLQQFDPGLPVIEAPDFKPITPTELAKAVARRKAAEAVCEALVDNIKLGARYAGQVHELLLAWQALKESERS